MISLECRVFSNKTKRENCSKNFADITAKNDGKKKCIFPRAFLRSLCPSLNTGLTGTLTVNLPAW